MNEYNPIRNDRKFEKELAILKEKSLGETARVEEWERKELARIQMQLSNSELLVADKVPQAEIERIRQEAIEKITRARKKATNDIRQILQTLDQSIEILKKIYNPPGTPQTPKEKQTTHTEMAKKLYLYNNPNADKEITEALNKVHEKFKEAGHDPYTESISLIDPKKN